MGLQAGICREIRKLLCPGSAPACEQGMSDLKTVQTARAWEWSGKRTEWKEEEGAGKW